MKHVKQRIQAYCDGELAPEARAAVEAHVRECAGCRAELEAAQRLWETVATAARATAAPSLWPDLEARIGRRSRSRSWTWPQRGLAAAAMLAGIVIGLGLGGLGHRGSAGAEATTASADYLDESLPTLDQLWLQLGDSNEDAGS